MLKSRILFTVAVCILALAAMPAGASIRLDENFEGASAFVNAGYPVQETTAAVTAGSLSTQGVNIRSWDAANSAPLHVVSTTGAVVTSRYFAGDKSLQLESGENLASVGALGAIESGWFKDLQLALSVDDAVYGLADGTVIGTVKWMWSTDDVHTTTEYTHQLDLVMNGSTAVDLKLGSTVVGSLTGSQGDWLVVTMIGNTKEDTPAGYKFCCLDPLTSTYKGPQPTGSPTATADAGWPLILPGIGLYVNSNTVAVQTAPADIGATWGNSVGEDTGEVGIEVAATNGGILYVDEMYWGTSAHQEAQRGYDGEAAARLIAFDAAPEETAPAPPDPDSAVAVWEIFY